MEAADLINDIVTQVGNEAISLKDAASRLKSRIESLANEHCIWRAGGHISLALKIIGRIYPEVRDALEKRCAGNREEVAPNEISTRNGDLNVYVNWTINFVLRGLLLLESADSRRFGIRQLLEAFADYSPRLSEAYID